MTSARDHGAMCYEMLRLDGEIFKKELGKLYSWINDQGRPDILCLSTALQSGFAREIKKQWDIPVVCYFQGEDSFLDSLPDEYRDSCWELMANRCRDADLLIAPSKFYARLMEKRLGLDEGAIDVQYNGINLDGFIERAAPATPTIGYLARMCAVKGLPLLVDAFIQLRTALGDAKTQLKIAGAMTEGDIPLVDSLKEKIETAGLTDSVEWRPNISREEKQSFLSELSLFTVPVQYDEAFGLYILEAMAASVAVAQPNRSAFPELIESTGGGVCIDIEGPDSLALAWKDLLADPGRVMKLGEQGRLGVESQYSKDRMRDSFISVMESLLQAKT